MKIKIKGFIQIPSYSKEMVFVGSDMTEYGYINVGEVESEIDYEVPEDFNPVATLNKKLDELNDKHVKQVRTIKREISELLCIENSPTVS